MGESDTLQWHRTLVAGLVALLGRNGAQVAQQETHTATVLLAGDRAYKLKKPVDLGFLDFSSAEQRLHFCNEELRLNRRYAADVYLRVAAITGSLDEPRLDGHGPVLDHAVVMRRFATDCQLDRLLARDGLTSRDIQTMAAEMARFHGECAMLPARHPLHSADALLDPLRDNLEECRAQLPDSAGLRQCLDWSHDQLNGTRPLVAARLRQGCVRECHGDLHLANMFREDGRIRFFDGIEFSEPLRYIDVYNELAFPAMDLASRGRADLAAMLVSLYLEWTGDYSGLPLLRLFLVYRALVRAKVHAIRLRESDKAPGRGGDIARYLEVAAACTTPPAPRLWLMGGLSGSGKSTRALEIVARDGAIRIRSDVERKRLFGLAPDARTDSPAGGGLYTPEAGQRTYQRLLELAREILCSGWSVVVDAANLRRAERARFRALAAETGHAFKLVWCEASEEELRRRIRQRQAAATDPSEASESVLDRQLATAEYPDANELRAD